MTVHLSNPSGETGSELPGKLFNGVNDLEFSSPLDHSFTVMRFFVVSQVPGHLSVAHKAIQESRIDTSEDCRGADS